MMREITSRIVELEAPGRLRWRIENLDPDSLDDNQVLVQTEVSVISPGTELAAWRGDPPLRPMKVYPRLVGYCNVGKVIAAGSAVQRFTKGDRVLSFQSHRSAFIAAEETVPGKIPVGLSSVSAAAVYLFHLGYNALLKGSFTAGMNVAVIGLGALGLAATALAAGFGGKVFAFSGCTQLREAAKNNGAFAVFPKSITGVEEKISDLTRGIGIDLVISTSNLWPDWELALKSARKGGTICVLGFPGRGQEAPAFNPLASQYFYDKQLRLIACGFSPDIEAEPANIRFTLRRNLDFLLELIAEKKLSADILISETIDASEIEEGYRRLAEHKEPLVTLALDWSENNG